MDELIGDDWDDDIGYDDDDDIGYDDDDEIGDELDELLAVMGEDDDDDIGDDDDDDIGDDDDFVGDFVGADELVGRRRRRRRRRRRLRGRGRRRGRRRRGGRRRKIASRIKRLAKKRSRGMKSVPKMMAAGRQIWLGAEKEATSSGQLLLTSTVQELCRVVRLVLAVRDAQSQAVDLGTVSIGDIKVGTRSQFTALQPVPAIMLATDSQTNNQGYLTDTIQPGTDFAVIIANGVSGQTYTFGAVARTLR